MRWGVITFPGSNDDEQTAFVLERLLGESVVRLWQHVLSSLPLAGAPTWLHPTLLEVLSPL